jgi:hypothetical protein
MERAGEAIRYLAANYPECAGAEAWTPTTTPSTRRL